MRRIIKVKEAKIHPDTEGMKNTEFEMNNYTPNNSMGSAVLRSLRSDDLKYDYNMTHAEKISNNWTFNPELGSIEPKTAKNPESHYTAFQKSLKILLLCGQAIGLIPVQGITEEDASKVKFKLYSGRSLYSCLLCALQGVVTGLCVYKLLRTNLSIAVFSMVSAYGTTFITTVLCIRIATKWPFLVRDVNSTALDDYSDPKMKLKCDIITIVFFIVALVEHILSIIAKISESLDCYPERQDAFETYIETIGPWLYDVGFTYNVPSGIFLEILEIISDLNWTYSTLLIVCLSINLTTPMARINMKIEQARGKYLPSSFWRALREDYNRATRLVHSVDDVINGLIFLSFANNLFYICLQIFNLLTYGIMHRIPMDRCPNYPSGPFNGFEHAIYFTFSLIAMFARFLAVSLVAGNVNSLSTVPAPALYDVPSPVYCAEVQRFLDQIHGDTVALSGLQFFNVTKGLLLTITGTIVTYELVLIQFDGDQ